ncbi:MAG: hypothetical protein ABJE66_22975 [Deltaproteobacteria bacterium]
MAHATTETKTKKHVSKRDGTDATADAGSDANSQMTQTIDRAADFIREQPFHAVGLALGAGYLGRILFRGPLATLAMLGGVGYLGARLAAK